jgi:hypothetical protein
MRVIPRRAKFKIHHERERAPIAIVASAALAAERIGDGRLIPLLIVDTSSRPDLEELIRLHEFVSPGDVDLQWGHTGRSREKIALFLSFKRPMELVAIVEFDIVEEGVLVDEILSAKIMYLQAGKLGDSFLKNVNAPRIFIEIPDLGFRDAWDKMFHKRVAASFRARGLSRQEAKVSARNCIREIRKIGSIRMK